MGCGSSKSKNLNLVEVPEAVPAPQKEPEVAPVSEVSVAVESAPVSEAAPATPVKPAAEVDMVSPASPSEDIKPEDVTAPTPQLNRIATESMLLEEEEEITGILFKKGEAGRIGASKYKLRFVVLKDGELTYYPSQGHYESGKGPIKNQRVVLKSYAIIRAPSSAPYAATAFSLEPLALVPVLAEEYKGSSTRRWEFRSVEEQDTAEWISVFVELGCMSEEEYTAKKSLPAPSPAAEAAVEAAKEAAVEEAAAAAAEDAAEDAAGASSSDLLKTSSTMAISSRNVVGAAAVPMTGPSTTRLEEQWTPVKAQQ